MRIFFVGVFLFAITAVVGWVMNIIKIIGMLDDPTITPWLVVRIIGAVAAPIGAILGYF